MQLRCRSRMVFYCTALVLFCCFLLISVIFHGTYSQQRSSLYHNGTVDADQHLDSPTDFSTSNLAQSNTLINAGTCLSPKQKFGDISWPVLGNVCVKDAPFLLVIVHTAPVNYKRRMEIRRTWGNQNQFSELHILVLFVLGQTGDPTVDLALKREATEFNDILGGNFHDTYDNLSYKALSWLAWIQDHCSTVSFILKTDDDVLVNIFSFVRHVRELQRLGTIGHRTFACMVWNGMPVQRDKSSKWYVSSDTYAGLSFPRYCSGMAYLLTVDLVPLLCQASLMEKVLWIDDVYLTGILPQGIGNVTYHELNSLYVLTTNGGMDAKISDGVALFAHVPTSPELRSRLWKAILKLRTTHRQSDDNR